MDYYTLEITQNAIIVHNRVLPKSRAKYHAPGLQINIIGAVTTARRASVNYHAFDICRNHHIPLIQLTAEGWVK